MRVSDDEANRLADSIKEAKAKLRFCAKCQNITERELCEICIDGRRDQSLICVVGEARDVAAIERINGFNGLYHVLHGLLSPMDGVGPEQLRIKELLARVNDSLHEIIVATNPTIEGDATALYLAKLLKPLDIKVSRLAHGMPVGGELDYADSATLLSALEYRRDL